MSPDEANERKCRTRLWAFLADYATGKRRDFEKSTVESMVYVVDDLRSRFDTPSTREREVVAQATMGQAGHGQPRGELGRRWCGMKVTCARETGT